MCTVSAIHDNWNDRLPDRYPWIQTSPNLQVTIPPSREEFDRLKAEVDELRKLLEVAKAFDVATGQPDCETDEKTVLLRKLAEILGVDLGL